MIGLDWIGSILSISGILLNANKHMWCWPVWLLSNVVWLVHTAMIGEWAAFVMWVVFVFGNIYGWYCWIRDDEDFQILQDYKYEWHMIPESRLGEFNNLNTKIENLDCAGLKYHDVVDAFNQRFEDTLIESTNKN